MSPRSSTLDQAAAAGDGPRASDTGCQRRSRRLGYRAKGRPVWRTFIYGRRPSKTEAPSVARQSPGSPMPSRRSTRYGRCESSNPRLHNPSLPRPEPGCSSCRAALHRCRNISIKASAYRTEYQDVDRPLGEISDSSRSDLVSDRIHHQTP